MIWHKGGAGGALSGASLGIAAALVIASVTAGPADARSHRHRHSHTEASHHRHHHDDSDASEARNSSGARYADIVVDANSGEVLHDSNADSLRHPASLTKIMTLYLLFEQLEAGKIKLSSLLHVSPHAASQSPTKLGLKAGETIAVEDAIKAIVTESANDMAVVIAETIGGDEDTFARMMTRKAHALGMTRTVYVNASGLPADEQLTTARDQALLGRLIQERFAIYYRYFATATFHYRGRAMRNHNHLLGNVVGVDGIKTGYTQASGFNLVTSVRRGDRHLVAVVMGGTSGGARDARMRSLIEEHIAEASRRRIAPVLADAGEARTRARSLNAVEPPTRAPAAEHSVSARFDAAAPVAPAPKPGSADPIQPIHVKTINVRAGAVQTAALAPLVSAAPQSTVAPQWASRSPQPAASPQPPGAVPQTSAAAPVAQQGAAPVPQLVAPPPAPPAVAADTGLPAPNPRPGILGTLPVRSAALAPMLETPPAPPAAPRPAAAASLRAFAQEPDAEPVAAVPDEPAPISHLSHARGEWMIQLGAFPEEAQAKERLKSAQSMAQSILAHAEGFTEKVVKGSKELYRARFAGLDKDGAEAACHYFKRNDIACMALKN